MLESGSFNAHKTTVASMIVILGCSEVDTKVSDAGMETVESDDCREVSRDNRDANGILVTM